MFFEKRLWQAESGLKTKPKVLNKTRYSKLLQAQTQLSLLTDAQIFRLAIHDYYYASKEYYCLSLD